MIGAAFVFPAFSKAAPRVITAGYGYRRRIVIPASAHRLGSTDGAVVIGFLETEPWLRTVANGGRVQSALGHDIRFEIDNGTKLPHDLATYVPTTGRIEAWVRLPTAFAGQGISFAIIYGNPAQTTAEANPSLTWAGFRWSLDVATGLDASPSSAHVTNTDVVATTLLGMDAGSFTP